MAFFPRGLYAVTPDEPETPVLLARVRAALAGGASAIQYRNKTARRIVQQEQATAIAAACKTAGVPLIVNDDVTLALDVDADGVHLGRDDGDLPAARARLGPHKLLGASCYDRLDLALHAAGAGADYVAFGSFFPSSTKPNAVRASPDLLSAAKQRIAIPVVAIGGITLDNAPPVIASGADAIAVVTALFHAEDIEARARAFQRLFERTV